MTDQNAGLGETSGFQIRTKGHISERWSGWFDGFDIRLDADGTTLISVTPMGPHGESDPVTNP